MSESDEYIQEVKEITSRPCRCGECEECRKIMFEEELQQEHWRRMGYIS